MRKFKNKKLITKTFILFLLLIVPSFLYALSQIWDFNIESEYYLSNPYVTEITEWVWRLAVWWKFLWQISHWEQWAALRKVESIFVDWDYAYVATNSSWSVEVIDFSVKNTPIWVWSIKHKNWKGPQLKWARAITKKWDYIFVSSNISDAIEIIDVSDPTDPTHVMAIKNWWQKYLNWTSALTIQWNYLYVTAFIDDAINIFDISDPTNTFLIWSLKDLDGRLDWAEGVAVSWNYAYVTSRRDDSFQVIDISDPSNPFFAWELRNWWNVLLGEPRDVKIKWDFAYVVSYVTDSLEVIDISDPTNPIHASSYEDWWYIVLDWAAEIEIIWEVAYIAATHWGAMQSVKISDPYNPIWLATYMIPWASALYKLWNYIYLWSDNPVDRVEIIDPWYTGLEPYIEWITPLVYYSWSIDFLTSIPWPLNQWNITYQISKDNWNSWYYFTWWTRYIASWTWLSETSTPAQINTRFPTFNWIAWWSWEFKWRSFLSSDWLQKTEIDEVIIDYTEDSAGDIIDFEVPWWYNVISWIYSRLTTNPYEWTISIESENKVANSTSCFEVYREAFLTSKITFNKNVSSWLNWDYLRFYIDWILIDEWSWEIWWSEEWFHLIPVWDHTYTWCYEKDNNNNNDGLLDTAMIDYIEITEDIDPVVNLIFPSNNDLLPMWNFNIQFGYTDEVGWSWIDVNSDIITLYKWDWIAWWPDISSTKLGTWTVTLTNASYPTNNLDFWKYKSDFQISDIARNHWTWSVIFYVDQIEFIINTWSLDIWNLQAWINKFSPLDFTITIKTVWAWFDLLLDKQTPLKYWTTEIPDWNWTTWYWYDKAPYSSAINLINPNEIISTQSWSLDINWYKQSYIFNVKFWAHIETEQTAGDYVSKIKFWLDLDY